MSIASYEGMLVVDGSLSQAGLEALLATNQPPEQLPVEESLAIPTADQLAGKAALSGAALIE